MAGDYPDVYRAGTLEDAVRELSRLGDDGAALAGCTWIMRAPSRGERLRRTYVSLQDLGELRLVAVGDPTLVGALVTHAELAGIEHRALGALAEAARRSANRAVRNVATLGGNLCARPFPASDLVPALLACEATVQVVSAAGTDELALGGWGARPAGEIVTGVRLPAPEDRRSWYGRLTVRGSSEYPIAGVAVSVDVAGDGTVAAARVAVGGVEEAARRVPEAEAALAGARLTPESGTAAGEAAAEAMVGRDGVDAPGWYRLAVLPRVCRDVVERL